MSGIVVTIPAYNEEKTIGKVVESIHAVLDDMEHKIIVVSDGSTDKTPEVAAGYDADVYNKRHSGLADTFRIEMAVALMQEPSVIIHTDADGQYLARDIPQLLKVFNRGTDLVLGSRLKGNIIDMPRSKESCNWFLTFLIKTWLRADITDATTGFRAFKPEVAKLPIRSNYTYTIEQIVRAKKAGFEIRSTPINFIGREDGSSRLMKHPLHYMWETVKNFRRMTQ